MGHFTTFSLDEKISLLKQLEMRQVLGPLKQQGSGDRVATEFDTKDINIENQIEKLKNAILDDPNFNNTNPLWSVLTKGERRGITRTDFGGQSAGYGGSGDRWYDPN